MTIYEHQCVECGRVVLANEPPDPSRDFICGPHDREHGAVTPGGLGVPARHAPVAAQSVELQTRRNPRCRSVNPGLPTERGRHIFEPFTPSDDLGGGAQRCECGKVLIDRTLGGGRVVEISR